MQEILVCVQEQVSRWDSKKLKVIPGNQGCDSAVILFSVKGKVVPVPFFN
jgi:hypothetical protein